MTQWWKPWPSSWARIVTSVIEPEYVMYTRGVRDFANDVQYAPGRLLAPWVASIQRFSTIMRTKSPISESTLP